MRDPFKIVHDTVRTFAVVHRYLAILECLGPAMVCEPSLALVLNHRHALTNNNKA